MTIYHACILSNCHHRPSDPSHQKQSPNDINQLKTVKLTLTARVTDGPPLAEGPDDGRDLKDAEFYKQQVKALFRNLSRGQNEASRMSIETGPYIFHYIIEGCVC
nr:25.3 kda vesicle transport protein [Quercus suber]